MRIFLILIVLFIYCQNESSNFKIIGSSNSMEESNAMQLTRVQNILGIYIPRSVLDSQSEYQMDFGRYAYEYYNYSENYPRLIISHPDQTGTYSKNDVYKKAEVLKKCYQKISDSLIMDSFYFKNKYIVFFKHQHYYFRKMPIQTFITYLPSPDLKQFYTIEVECPNTRKGDILKDSILKIFESIQFQNWKNME